MQIMCNCLSIKKMVRFGLNQRINLPSNQKLDNLVLIIEITGSQILFRVLLGAFWTSPGLLDTS